MMGEKGKRPEPDGIKEKKKKNAVKPSFSKHPLPPQTTDRTNLTLKHT